MTQWDFQNKGTRTSPARLSFVLKVPLRHLRPSVIYSVPCDRILQMAHISHLGVLSVLAQQTELSQSNTHMSYVHVVFKCQEQDT